MTTEPSQVTAPRGGSVLTGAATAGLAAAVVTVVVAVLAGGVEGLVGAVVGGPMTLAVLGVGTWVVLRVARTSPMASLLAALVTFTTQGLLLLLTLAVLAGLTSGHQVTWAAVAVIAVTLVWTTMFAVRARTERILIFDLPNSADAEEQRSPEATAR